jgi:hypothetical protein
MYAADQLISLGGLASRMGYLGGGLLTNHQLSNKAAKRTQF